MRAVWTTGTKGPDSLEVRETPDPEPAAGQVRIRVSAAGLCFAEVMAVLVHMAAGGLGTAALQLCRTVDGVQTFGTASAAKHEAIRREGCTYPIDYHAVDYVKEVRRLTDGAGVDVVLDPLGGADSRKGLALLRPGGRLVVYGFANMTSGERRHRARMLRQAVSMPLLTPLQLMNANKAVAGVHIGRLVDRIDLLTAELTEVMALWAAGTITPRLDGTYPFDRAADAHRRILSHGNTGKIILTP